MAINWKELSRKTGIMYGKLLKVAKGEKEIKTEAEKKRIKPVLENAIGGMFGHSVSIVDHDGDPEDDIEQPTCPDDD